MKYILFILLLLNMTAGLNNWMIGRQCFWMAALVGAYFIFSRYGLKSLVLVFLLPIVKLLSVANSQFNFLYDLILFIFFALTGFVCFGLQLHKIRRLLVLYLLFCIPFMVMQIIGISPTLMYWNTDYAHDEFMLSVDEIGTFKDMVMYPTFLVDVSEIYYQQGQGRPPGLSPANNLLSVLVSFAAVLNLHIRNKSKMNLGDFVITLAAVLVASKLGIIVLIFIYSYALFSQSNKIRIIAIKNTILTILSLALYRVFFPGVFEINFGVAGISMSFGVRIVDLFLSIGLSNLIELFWFASSEFDINLEGQNKDEGGYSSIISNYINSSFLIILLTLPIIGYIIIKFYKKLKPLKFALPNMYEFYVSFIVTMFLCILAVPVFFKSIIFALIVGIIIQILVKDYKKNI